MNEKALLLLADGTLIEAKSIGYSGIATAEVCFNTGMTGYQEIYSDPSYFGQILITSSVHIGNYGVLDSENQSKKIMVRGIIVRNFSTFFSRYQATSLDAFLKKHHIVGIGDVDTRYLVKKIRQKGSMNGVLCSVKKTKEELTQILNTIPNMSGLELASKVSTKEPYFYGDVQSTYRIAVIDLGVKKEILKYLSQKGNYCCVFPHNTSYREIMDWSPSGILISNGPGDPTSMYEVIENVAKLIEKQIPMFGICLGHQIIALAMGCKTYKMLYGHRGLNHPVKNLLTGSCQITSQNHGFSVSIDSVKKCRDIEITHINLNDNTMEGMRVKGKNIFCVQYHPEAAPGPHDSFCLFDEFQEMIIEFSKTQSL